MPITSAIPSAGSPFYYILALTVVIALLCVLCLVLIRRGKLRITSIAAAHFFEALVLLLGMFVLSAWLTNGVTGGGFLADYPSYGETSALETVLVGGFFYGLFSLPILLLARFARSRLLVVLGGLLWVFVVCLRIYIWKTLPIIQEIREQDAANLFQHRILLDAWIIVPRIWIWALVSVLGGFYAVRRAFSFTGLVLGTMAAGYLFGFLCNPFYLWPRWWLAPVCYAAFAGLLVSLPVQRGAMERLLGIRLRKGAAAAPLPYSTAGSLAGHLMLVLLAVGIACSASISYYESRQYALVLHGVAPTWHSSAERNAFDDMKLYFRNGEAYPSITAASQPEDYDKALKLLVDHISTGTREQTLSQLNVPALKAYFHRIDEFAAAFVAAGHADYLEFPSAEYLNYLNLREASRALGIRSQIALAEGRVAESTEDVAAIYRMGGLLRNQPFLISQMVGVALRNTGTSAAWNLLASSPGNKEMLDALSATLQEAMPLCRVGLDYEALKQGELNLLGGPVIPNASFIPALGRVHRFGLTSWMNFDLVYIATALERYKLATGVYPDALGSLAPAYLKRIPFEPFEGREYSYSRTADGWYELSDLAKGSHDKSSQTSPLYMPPMRAQDPVKTGKAVR